MGTELPILPSPSDASAGQQEEAPTLSRVFCIRENSPTLRLLLDFLKSRGQTLFHTKMDPAALDDWSWIRVTLGYNREKKPIQVFCLRDGGTHTDLLEKERAYFLERLGMYEDEEAGLMRHYVTKARFMVGTAYTKSDMTEEGYDFTGWILQFFQENCDGVVQADGQGFFSPKGDLVVEIEEEY